MTQTMTFVGAVLLVSLVFLSWGIITSDFEDNYVDTGISPASPVNETFKGLLNKTDEITEEIETLEEPLRDFGSGEDSGFKLFQDTLAVAKVFVIFPGVMLDILLIAKDQALTAGNIAGVPLPIIGVAIASVIAMVIIILINAIRRYEA